MKHFIVAISTLIIILPAQAQDGSMTLSHRKDSVRYNVLNLSKDQYSFQLKENQHNDSLLILSDSTQQIDRKIVKQSTRNDLLPWRISLVTGYGFRIAPAPYDLPDALVNYKNGLRTGLSMGADIVHFLNPNVGLGLRYNLFHTQNQKDLSYAASEETINSFRSDNIFVHYFGPAVNLRSIVKKDKLYTSFEFSLGYTSFYNDHFADGNRYSVSGKNFGFVSSIGADFVINRGVSLGLNMNIMAASIDKLRINDNEMTLSHDDIENLSRISLGVVMRYYR